MTAVDLSAVSRIVGSEISFKVFEKGRVTFLPQQLAVIGQGNTASSYSLDPVTLASQGEVAAAFGFGSPLHLAARQLFPINGDGIGGIPVTFYPMEDDGSGVEASGSIAAAGTQTTADEYIVKVNEIPAASVVLPVGTTASAAITLIKTAMDATLELPVTTGSNTGVETSLDIDSKWKGESANDIYIEIEGTEAGITFTVTQLTGGLVNPDVDTPLAKIVNKWETAILNCLNYDDTTTLGKYTTFGEGRWDPLVKKPLYVLSGTGDDRATRTAITDARKTDRINSLIAAPGCNELPLVIAARAASRILRISNNNPPDNFYGRLTGLVPGPDTSQESYTNRDLAVKAGSGTTILVDGEIELNDVVTMYHPDGEVPPAFRYVVDIIKLQNIQFNKLLITESDEWKGAPLLPDATPTVNPRAKKPKNLKSALGNLADNLALQAIISDPEFTKENIEVNISSTNPKRLEDIFPVKLSGNVEIIDSTTYFGFYFGSLT